MKKNNNNTFCPKRIRLLISNEIMCRRYLYNWNVIRTTHSFVGKEKETRVVQGRQAVFNSILSELKLKLSLDSTPINNNTQLELENFTKLQFVNFSQEKNNFKSTKKIFNEINLDMFSPKINQKIIESLDLFVQYLNALKKGHSNDLSLLSDIKNPTKDEIRRIKDLKNSIKLLNHTSADILARYCISHYLRIVSGIKNNDFGSCGYLNSSTKLVIFITEAYHYSLYKKVLINNTNLRYSEWFNSLDEGEKFSNDNLFNITLGQSLSEIYTKLGLLELEVVSASELLLNRDSKDT